MSKRAPRTTRTPITQQAEPYNGINRKERRRLDTVNRLAVRAEMRKAEARYVDFGGADATEPEPAADAVERPCVYAKAVHAAKMARRRGRARTGHGGAAARERRRAKRAAVSPLEQEAQIHAAMGR